MTTIEILNQSTIDPEECVLRLPDITLDRNDYLAVKKQLESINGKWNRHKGGFVFPTDPTPLIELLKSGKAVNVDFKKLYQFYPTPYRVAEMLTDYMSDVKDSDRVLEPSAGQGSLVSAIRRVNPSVTVDCFELMPTNRMILEHVPGANIIGQDFLEAEPKPIYDKIIANPPFAKNQDIEHVKRMYEWLSDEGEIVTVMSPHWTFASDKKSVAFREWLDSVGGLVMDELEPGDFKESGTMVRSVIVRICK